MLRIFKKVSPIDRVLILIAVLTVVAHVWLELKMPDYMSEITTLVQTQDSVMEEIWHAGIMMLLCALGSLVVSILTSVLSSRIATDFGASLRQELFEKVQSFSMAEIGRFSTASLITRSTNDVTQVQNLITMGLQAMVKAPIMAIWAIAKISNKSWQWTAATGAAVIVLMCGVTVVVMVVVPKFKRLQALTDDLNRVSRENLTGIRVVRAFNAEGYQEKKFDGANDTLTKTQLFTGRVMSALSPGMQFIMSGLSLSIYWIGGYLIEAADMGSKLQLFSDMVVFSQYAMQVVMSFLMLVIIFMTLPRASVSAKRILEVLDTDLSVRDGKGAAPKAAGEIEFKNVSFRYPDAEGDVLHDISFSAHRGETVAFIGATGCGKSTAVNLIPRFFDATRGEVLVDGVNVKDYTLKELHNRVAYISQNAVLFRGSIKSNVAYGDNGRGEADDARVQAAIATAQAAEFVDKQDKGIYSRVSQNGTNLSGGQKQRVSIARALARDAEIIIFDDSFSALDYKTDRVLRDALAKECAEATKIIVAQRIGTIRDADRIIVLDNGVVAGIGRHSELMENCEVYRQIAYSQLSKEELA